MKRQRKNQKESGQLSEKALARRQRRETRRKQSAGQWAVDLLFFFVGSALYALSVNFFTAPNDIAPGGATGLATLANYLFGLPIGVGILLVNLPLFALAIWLLGGSFTVKTIIATVMMSVLVDLTSFIPHYSGDKILCALFGGILSGAGMALVFLRGGTTGGTDILSRLLRLKWRSIPMGRMILLVDLVVILLAGLVYRQIESALYAIIVIFCSTKVIDSALYGLDNGKSFLIVSDKNREIAEQIVEKMHRGVTILQGKGYYSDTEKQVLLCTVRRNEAAELSDIVKAADSSAFMIVSDAGEIRGEGFRSWDSPTM